MKIKPRTKANKLALQNHIMYKEPKVPLTTMVQRSCERYNAIFGKRAKQ